MRKKSPPNGYRKKNNCPYCGYFCDAATLPGNDKKSPKIGDLSFCLMCVNPSMFDNDFKLVKFDLNSIKDIVERNKLKIMQLEIKRFYEENPKLQDKIKQYINKDL